MVEGAAGRGGASARDRCLTCLPAGPVCCTVAPFPLLFKVVDPSLSPVVRLSIEIRWGSYFVCGLLPLSHFPFCDLCFTCIVQDCG